MSYGHQQETTAEALRQLLTGDTVPTDADDRAQLVTIRDQLRLALMDQVTVIARGNVAIDDRFQTERGMLSTLGYRGLQHLSRIMAETPRPRGHLRTSPVEVLAKTAAHPIVELWRRTAVAISVGNHDLDAGLRHGITAAGTWYLLRDAAHTVEAFIVLDDRLDTAGLLDRHHRPQRPWKLRARRAITATIAREASWHATDSTPDQASAQALQHSVQLVRDLDSLAAAQRRLAEFVRPQHAGSLSFDPLRELTLAEARPLLLAQARLAHQLSQAVPPDASGDFAKRRDLLLAVRRATASLHDVVPRPPRRLLTLQSGEIIRSLDRIPAWSQRNPTAVSDLNAASTEVATQIGRAIARGCRRRSHTPFAQYQDGPTGDVLVPAVLDRGHHLPAACLRVTSGQPDAPPEMSAPQRSALAATLARTPTRYRQPPYSDRQHPARR